MFTVFLLLIEIQVFLIDGVLFFFLVQCSAENDGYIAHDIRRSVREAALSKPVRNTEKPQDKSSDDGSEHFFIPLSTGASVKEMDAANNRRKQRSIVSSPQMKFPTSTSDHYYGTSSPLSTSPVLFSELNGHQSFMTDDALDQVFSPPLLLESSLFPDADEDLLGTTTFQNCCYR